MKRNRKLWALLLCLIMIFGIFRGASPAAARQFSDVPENAWFAGDVDYISNAGLMNGVGGGNFDPNGPVVRAMVVTILHRLAGSPDMNANMRFTDIDDSAYYAAAVRWAAAYGIVLGYDDTHFGPNDRITREQFAAILARYAATQGINAGSTTPIDGFADASSVSDYARDAMAWCVGSGIINGTGVNNLDPRADASRAQAAAIIRRFVALIGNASANAADSGEQDDKKKEEQNNSGHATVPGALGGTGIGTGNTGVTTGRNQPLQNGKYNVSINANNGTEIYTYEADPGTMISRPAVPVKDGYTFVNWYTDGSFSSLFDFSQPVSGHVTLYAKWAKTEAAFFDLSTNKTSISLAGGDESTVMFWLETDLQGVDNVGLYLNDVQIAEFANDGMYTWSGDDMFGDGIFTTSVIPLNLADLITADGDAVFTARYGSYSDSVTISCYTPIGGTTMQNMRAVDNAVEDLMSSAEFKAMTEDAQVAAMEDMLKDLETAGRIEAGTIAYDTASGVFGFEYAGGIIGGVMIREFDPDMDGAAAMTDDIVLLGFAENDVFVKKFAPGDASKVVGSALILNAFPAFESSPKDILYRTDFYVNLQKDWSRGGLLTTLDTDVTVGDFLRFGQYDVVSISTHGSRVSLWESGSLISYSAICLAEKSTDTKDQQYADYLKDNQIAVINSSIGRCYWILPGFFEKQMNSGNSGRGTVVFNQCCKSFGTGSTNDTTMAAAILSSDPDGAVIGFRNSVYSDYGRTFMQELINGMITGMTLAEAFDAASEEIGSDDRVWYEREIGPYDMSAKPIAVPNIYGNRNKTLSAKGEVPLNGDFEIAGLGLTGFTPYYWTAEGDVRSIRQLGDVKPYNNRMAIVSSGIGSGQNAILGMDGTEGSRMSQTFTIPQNARVLRFNYNYVSEEPMEFVGSIFDDSFEVQLSSNNTILQAVQYESINTSQWYSLGDVDFYGGDSTAFQTRWKQAELDVSMYAGQTVTLSFIVYDKGDEIYDSACLIDNVALY